MKTHLSREFFFIFNCRSSQTSFWLVCIVVANGELIHRRLNRHQRIENARHGVPVTLNLRLIRSRKRLRCLWHHFACATFMVPCVALKVTFLLLLAAMTRYTRRFQERPSPSMLHSFIAPIKLRSQEIVFDFFARFFPSLRSSLHLTSKSLLDIFTQNKP